MPNLFDTDIFLLFCMPAQTTAHTAEVDALPTLTGQKMKMFGGFRQKGG